MGSEFVSCCKQTAFNPDHKMFIRVEATKAIVTRLHLVTHIEPQQARSNFPGLPRGAMTCRRLRRIPGAEVSAISKLGFVDFLGTTKVLLLKIWELVAPVSSPGMGPAALWGPHGSEEADLSCPRFHRCQDTASVPLHLIKFTEGFFRGPGLCFFPIQGTATNS